MKSSKAFTMIELIFVIIVLGILASIALPKFGGVKEQADIANGKAQLAAIRTAIVNERQRRLILGDSSYITKANLSSSSSALFDGVLTTPISGSSSAGNWSAVNIANGTYNYNVSGVNTLFTYEDENGTITCTAGSNNCDDLN